MTIAEKHIRHYNNLNGKEISKETLRRFHDDLKKDIAAKRIDEHAPYGAECIGIEKRLAKALTQMNGANRIVEVKKCIPLGNNLLVTQTARGPEVVKAKKAVHYHHEDVTMFYGLENIQDDKHLEAKSLDGPNDTTYKVITDRILALLKAGGLIWRKPWNTKVNGPTGLAHNYVTRNIYRSGNYYLNYLAFKHPMFFTFKQVTDLGGKVNKGEKGWPVVYFKWLYKNLKANKLVSKEEALQSGKLKPGYEKFPGLFYYNVFNYDQCSELKIKFRHQEKRTAKEKIESAEKIVADMPKKPAIKKGHERAFYSPSGDYVEMPGMDQFSVDQQYYSVLFHELVHSTGSPKRLDRDLSGRFGSKPYAFEELIAELGSSYLCGESGILYYTMKNSAAYIESWSGALKKEMEADPKFFLRASSAAQRAADFILDVKEGEEHKVPEATESTTKAIKVATKANRAPVKRKAKKFKHKSRGKKQKEIPVSGSNIKAVPSVSAGSRTQKIKKATLPPKESSVSGLGFITADKSPEKSGDTFTLPGPIGSILGKLQRYKLEIVVAGETHSGKSELGKQIADAFISYGDEVGYIDWEQGGMQSRDTKESIERNVSTENRKKLHVSSEVPRTLEAVKSLAKKFRVIMVDSGSKLNQVTNAWIDELREEYPDIVWIIIMQQNEKGGTRGGAAAEFDSPVVLKTYRPDHSDYRKNYAYVFKNRGNPETTGKYYLIADKKVVDKEPGTAPEVKPQPQPV
ncbi:MAG TPA: zincin-like metallopeptidase domain-containing protein [Chryseolinea sp.]|nr:zincin-like metallopeptidase domain-containing protein [Chryseolinea sp.]